MKRAITYVHQHPEDEPAVMAILNLTEAFSVSGPREVFEMVAGRQVDDSEWDKFKLRWQRSWDAVMK